MLDRGNQKIVVGDEIAIQGSEWRELASAFGGIRGEMKDNFRLYLGNVGGGFGTVAQVKLGKILLPRHVVHEPAGQIIHTIHRMLHLKKPVINMATNKTGRPGNKNLHVALLYAKNAKFARITGKV